jgi:hypothetical protein
MARFSPWPDSFFPLSPLRRTSAAVIRWIALPLAAFCLLVPLSVIGFLHRAEAGLVPADAIVLESRVVDASRIGSQYDLWVRYSSKGRTVEGPLRAWSTLGIAKGDTVHVFVDPGSGQVRDDPQALAWLVAAFGALAAAFFVVVGFLGMGEMLRRDRVARGIER